MISTFHRLVLSPDSVASQLLRSSPCVLHLTVIFLQIMITIFLSLFGPLTEPGYLFECVESPNPSINKSKVGLWTHLAVGAAASAVGPSVLSGVNSASGGRAALWPLCATERAADCPVTRRPPATERRGVCRPRRQVVGFRPGPTAGSLGLTHT